MDNELNVVDKMLEIASKRMAKYCLDNSDPKALKVAMSIGVARKYISLMNPPE